MSEKKTIKEKNDSLDSDGFSGKGIKRDHGTKIFGKSDSFHLIKAFDKSRFVNYCKD